MKTIGLIGGMSWESTLTYYKLINEGVKNQLGGLHSAKICLNSVDFDEIASLQHSGDWPKMARILRDSALSLERAGADFFLICTNTMHKVADEVCEGVSIPLVNIADVTGEALRSNGVRSVGLLGTRFTMEQAFYKDRLAENFKLNVLTPDEADRQTVHSIIYDELCLGIVKSSSRDVYQSIVEKLVNAGAEAIILGCTEIAMLLDAHQSDVPLYDTTHLHAQKAVALALTE